MKARDSDGEEELEMESAVIFTEEEPITRSEESPVARAIKREQLLFDDPACQDSRKVKCPFCDTVSISMIEYRPQLIGYLFIILSILVFGMAGFLLIPFLANLTKMAVHRCSKCLNEVMTDSVFGYSSMNDKIVQFQIGNFGVVLSRKTLLYMTAVCVLGLSLYGFVWVESGHNHDEVPINSGITWEGYIKDIED